MWKPGQDSRTTTEKVISGKNGEIQIQSIVQLAVLYRGSFIDSANLILGEAM